MGSELLASLRAAGFKVRRSDGKILIQPASRLTADQQQAVRENRDELLRVLHEEEYGPDRPPAGRATYYGDSKGRPATKTQARWWTWEGAPQWYRVHGAAGAEAEERAGGSGG